MVTSMPSERLRVSWVIFSKDLHRFNSFVCSHYQYELLGLEPLDTENLRAPEGGLHTIRPAVPQPTGVRDFSEKEAP